ncbi:hypothetical protein [uncultured Sneathiella sp.]|jgi:hypothetical protein|uniref:hypothetical protein n=1 Tax=uncultured Sneathiella sp. TaxID=879315 RepID=UPI0030DA8A53|tara:strand:- start:53376 stop:53711 length:336 start_codon:yes stop_codon:yes gene_type:complete
MNKVQDEVVCTVCNRKSGDLYHSGVGPVSYIRCSVCEEQGAEEIGVLCYTLYTQGGLDAVSQNTYLSKWWPTKRSFYDNQYIGWDEIKQIYPYMETKFAEEYDVDEIIWKD